MDKKAHQEKKIGRYSPTSRRFNPFTLFPFTTIAHSEYISRKIYRNITAHRPYTGFQFLDFYVFYYPEIMSRFDQ